MKTRSHFSARGYTLIEVMVAVALLGLVVTAVYSSWTAVVRASKVGLATAVEAQRIRIAVRVMESALSSACMFEANAPKWYWFEQDKNGLNFVARLPKWIPRGTTNFAGLDVWHVRFSIESGKRLVMWQSPLFPNTDDEEQNYPLELARDVNELGFQFWEELPGKLGRWVDDWKQTRTNQLPKMVKVKLQLGQGSSYYSSQPEEIVLEVGLPSRGVPRNYQMPTPTGIPPPPK
jgi:prepilin-type N-terminal cleavage/methylation domain-containing protein